MTTLRQMFLILLICKSNYYIATYMYVRDYRRPWCIVLESTWTHNNEIIFYNKVSRLGLE